MFQVIQQVINYERFKLKHYRGNLDDFVTSPNDDHLQVSRYDQEAGPNKKHRKPVSPTDNCCVCAEVMDPTTKDISFCSKCGQNIHEACIEAWKRSCGHTLHKEIPGTCPLCRTSWKNDPLLKRMTVEKELDAEAVQAYLDWLYTSCLPIAPSLSRKTDEFNLVMLKLWAVANAVEDETFKSIVMTTYFKDAKVSFGAESVKWAFVERKSDAQIREFVLDVSLVYITPGWFTKQGKDWPDEFLRALADAAMVGWQERKSFAELKEIWMQKLGKEGVSEDEEDWITKKKRQASADTAATCLDRPISGVERQLATPQHSGEK
ncbi:E3 ubiquitin- ligase Zswim2 [Pyrenophora seminiperda CCB06]|uniref:E3 ubiquitin-ligase Zswim2 n=1 Tax=Pyrenophora seminiperda CCB06 TaxID=1302712 RepID=A0A3M7M6X4_9PLEO|nr:E3 ubiquitin- ligase Zswim2 [Pyrenophora seminiperda CCB06]